jgi:hypothetical protein
MGLIACDYAQVQAWEGRGEFRPANGCGDWFVSSILRVHVRGAVDSCWWRLVLEVAVKERNERCLRRMILSWLTFGRSKVVFGWLNEIYSGWNGSL